MSVAGVQALIHAREYGEKMFETIDREKGFGAGVRNRDLFERMRLEIGGGREIGWGREGAVDGGGEL